MTKLLRLWLTLLLPLLAIGHAMADDNIIAIYGKTSVEPIYTCALTDLPVIKFTNTGIEVKASKGGQTELPLTSYNDLKRIDFLVTLDADVNGDDIINIADVLSVIGYMNGEITNISRSKADVDQSGAVDIADIHAVISSIVTGR